MNAFSRVERMLQTVFEERNVFLSFFNNASLVEKV